MKNVAIVLGSYVNGYELIRELNSFGINEILLIDFKKSLGAYSNKIFQFIKISNQEDLIFRLIELSKSYHKLVLFPTSDEFTECLYDNFSQIPTNCFIAFNEENLNVAITKKYQYQVCEKLNVPYPTTIFLEQVSNISQLYSIPIPFILKPSIRIDEKLGFRNKLINNSDDIKSIEPILKDCLQEGVQFLASEIIPGDGSNIYAYNAYRNKNGTILNEWTGKKLAQYPNDFGVFSSATQTNIDEALELKTLGRKLMEEMNLYGYVEPEFKFDSRDSKFKLMEINIRPMMWHKLGFLTGIPLNYIQWCDALGLPIPTFEQHLNKKTHYVYLQYEIINVLTRKGYYKTFKNNVFSKNKVVFAVYDKNDLKPFIFDLFKLVQRLILLLLNGGQPVNKHSSIVKKIKSFFK